jgi:hypothetical protein
MQTTTVDKWTYAFWKNRLWNVLSYIKKSAPRLIDFFIHLGNDLFENHPVLTLFVMAAVLYIVCSLCYNPSKFRTLFKYSPLAAFPLVIEFCINLLKPAPSHAQLVQTIWNKQNEKLRDSNASPKPTNVDPIYPFLKEEFYIAFLHCKKALGKLTKFFSQPWYDIFDNYYFSFIIMMLVIFMVVIWFLRTYPSLRRDLMEYNETARVPLPFEVIPLAPLAFIYLCVWDDVPLIFFLVVVALVFRFKW